MSWSFLHRSIEVLKVERLDEENRKMGAPEFLNLSGSFEIHPRLTENWCSRTLKFSRGIGEAIGLRMRRNFFGIRIPADAKLETEDENLWAGRSDSVVEAHFSWPKIPKTLFVKYANRQGLRFTVERRSWIQMHIPSLVSLSLLLAISLHLLAHLIGEMAMHSSYRNYLQRRKEIADISKIQVSLATTTSSAHSISGSLSPEAREFRRAKRLLDSWGVGKKVRVSHASLDSSRLLSETLAKDMETGSGKTLAHESWSIDSEKLESRLNLSGAEIAKYLRPAEPLLKNCYDDILVKDPTLRGKPELRINIDLQGRISAVHLDQLRANKKSLDALSSCFFDVYRKFQLPKPNREFSVIQTLVLEY